MEDSKSGPDSAIHSILDVLDRTLLSHLERITGTREGINGLPMDLLTVACIVLMAERSGKPGGPLENNVPYRRSDFEEELAEMGFADDQRVQGTMDAMVRMGYMEIDSLDGIKPGKPSVSMARLLDHAFPGMPGMNLVAYFVQTLDEVESGRKGTKDAIMQLDQMLRRHGASSFGRPSKGTHPETALPSKKDATPVSKTPSRPKRPSRLRIPAEILFPAPEGPAPSEEPLSDIPLPDEVGIEVSSEKEALNKDMSPEMHPPGPSDDPEDDTFSALEPPEPLEETGVVESVPDFETPAPDLAHEENPDDTVFPLHCETEPGEEESPSIEHSFDLQGEVAPAPEEPVDERVAAFEERLAMQCPVCRKSSIEARETAKGRTYYKCTDEQCMFISWGRPHHLACPLCGNTFLVESSSGEGSTILKCPRATCRYREDSSIEAGGGSTGSDSGRPSTAAGKPRRRVVRRRVLRRKR